MRDGEEVVIAYYSKALNPAQRKYCTTRKELLAVVAVLDAFRGHLLGPHFTVRSDHKALLWLSSMKVCSGMLACWFARLQQFDFEIVHRPGAQHCNADGLSRCPQCQFGGCADATPPLLPVVDAEQPFASSEVGSASAGSILREDIGELWIASITHNTSEPRASDDELIRFTSDQRSDPVVGILYRWLSENSFPECLADIGQGGSQELRTFWLGRENYYLDTSGLIWRRRTSINDATQIVVPRGRRQQLLRDYHDSPTILNSIH